MDGKPTKLRIAVALDASAPSRHTLRIAVGIAATLDAEIEGIFVEDADLLRMASLTFLRELRHASVGENALDAERLQREMRTLARRSRIALEESARRSGVAWTFRVWRGHIETEILDAAREAEMFALGRIGSFAPFHPRQKTQKHHGADNDFALSILFNGSDASNRALATGAELAERRHAPVTVLLQGNKRADIDQLRERATEQVGMLSGKILLLPLEAPDATRLAKAALRTDSGLLIVDVANPLLARRQLWQCLQALNCPVLVIR